MTQNNVVNQNVQVLENIQLMEPARNIAANTLHGTPQSLNQQSLNSSHRKFSIIVKYFIVLKEMLNI